MIIVFYLLAGFSLITNGALVDDCKNTPFWKLNLCEVMCDQCGTKGLCEICPSSFYLTKNTCQQDSSLIYYNSYFTTPQITTTAIDQKLFKASNQYLTVENILTFCQPNTYKFDMLGLFNQQTIITYTMNFNTPVTQVLIRLNFLTLYNNTKFQLVLNGEQVYQKVFTQSNLNSTYISSSGASSYINVPALMESSANVIVNKVQTDYIMISQDLFNQNNRLSIQIEYSANKTNISNFWAFSDFSIVATKCQDCIPQKLKTLASNVGIGIGIASAALVILILIMYACVKLEEKRRLDSHLPKEESQNLTEEEQKQHQKEEQKQNDLKIRQTMQQQQILISKKNKAT